jgi:hypothetical protein
VSVEELCRQLRDARTLHVPVPVRANAAELIDALMAEREAWRKWYDHRSTMGERTEANNHVDEIIGRIGK